MFRVSGYGFIDLLAVQQLTLQPLLSVSNSAVNLLMNSVTSKAWDSHAWGLTALLWKINKTMQII